MSTRAKYMLTKERMDKLLDEMSPKPVMYLTGGRPMFEDIQIRANKAWDNLGKEMGFIGSTVLPSEDGDQNQFTAIPTL